MLAGPALERPRKSAAITAAVCAADRTVGVPGGTAPPRTAGRCCWCPVITGMAGTHQGDDTAQSPIRTPVGASAQCAFTPGTVVPVRNMIVIASARKGALGHLHLSLPRPHRTSTIIIGAVAHRVGLPRRRTGAGARC